MPYIKQELRNKKYDDVIKRLIEFFHSSSYSFSYHIYEIKTEIVLSDSKGRYDGTLNYFLTKLFIALGDDIINETNSRNIEAFLIGLLKAIYEPSYFNYNRAIGTLSCCVRELKRRNRNVNYNFIYNIIDKFYDSVVAPYEDIKIKENGDVI